MRILTLGFLLCSIAGFSQPKKFKDLNAYSEWLTYYYLHPEPTTLFDGFHFIVKRKGIESDVLSLNMIFFASLLERDTVSANGFFDKLKTTRDRDLVFGAMEILWNMNSNYSHRKFIMFKYLDHLAKYRDDFEQVLKLKPYNVYKDPITNPAHLDMLWVTFFATGDSVCVDRIVDKMKDLNSSDMFQSSAAVSARWSLASNAQQHARVLEICQRLYDHAEGRQKENLKVIVDQKKAKAGR